MLLELRVLQLLLLSLMLVSWRLLFISFSYPSHSKKKVSTSVSPKKLPSSSRTEIGNFYIHSRPSEAKRSGKDRRTRGATVCGVRCLRIRLHPPILQEEKTVDGATYTFCFASLIFLDLVRYATQQLVSFFLALACIIKISPCPIRLSTDTYGALEGRRDASHRVARNDPARKVAWITRRTQLQKLQRHTTRGSQNQMQNQPEQNPMREYTGNTTRACGSRGIPETKLPPLSNLEDLDGMSEEEIAQALQENPHLANLAAEQAGTPRRQRKTEALDRLDMLKEQGVPYQQWAIILFVLGIAFYQLSCWMLKNNLWRPAKLQTRHRLAKKAKRSRRRNLATPTTERKFSVKSDDEVVAALEGSVGKHNGTAQKAGSGRQKEKEESCQTSQDRRDTRLGGHLIKESDYYCGFPGE